MRCQGPEKIKQISNNRYFQDINYPLYSVGMRTVTSFIEKAGHNKKEWNGKPRKHLKYSNPVPRPSGFI